MKALTAITGLLLTVVSLTGGCASVQVNNPIPIAVVEYDPVFEATLDVLRDMRFTVDRRDRRFGVITTRPFVASSVFEPWHNDNTTAYDVAESTMNHQRRWVRVEIYPLREDDEPTADGVTDYELFVQVFVERRQHPPRELNTAAIAEAQLRRRPQYHGAPLLTEEGYVQSHWRHVRRDEELERRLVAAILRRSIEIPATLGVE